MSFFDPLEQFSIEIYSSYFFNSIGICSSTSLGKMILFNFFLVIFSFYIVKGILLQNKLQKPVMLLFNFVATILKDSLSVKKYSFILLFYIIFLFIFVSNILGMLPYSITITSRSINHKQFSFLI